MTSAALLLLYGAALLLAAVLVSIGIWAPRRLALKVAALGVGAGFVVLAFASNIALLSRPKPVDLEWAGRTVAEADVIASDLREREAIYLWLRLPGVVEPRAYALPWSEQTARELRQAEQKAAEAKTALKMRQPFRRDNLDSDPTFYPQPQQPLPVKPGEAAGDWSAPVRPKSTANQ